MYIIVKKLVYSEEYNRYLDWQEQVTQEAETYGIKKEIGDFEGDKYSYVLQTLNIDTMERFSQSEENPDTHVFIENKDYTTLFAELTFDEMLTLWEKAGKTILK